MNPTKMRLTLSILGILAIVGPSRAEPTAQGSTPPITLEALRAKYTDRAGHVADIDGVEVYYKDEGKGPALLLIHGSVSTLQAYDGVAAKLTGKYRVIRYDTPPYGLSGPVSDEAASKLKPVDIPEQLLAKLNVKAVTVVAFSSGGLTAAALAAKRPGLVQRLILANVPADPVDSSHLKPTMVLDNSGLNFRSLSDWREFLDYFSGVPGRISPAEVQRVYDMNRRAPEKNPRSLVSLTSDHPHVVDTLAQVTSPTLLIWGERDLLLTPPTAAALAGYLTHADVSKVMLPDVGHYPTMEAPDRFAAIVANYIESVTPVLSAQ
jgi:pimeloyl-ACP methyl ester carboxylesterase